MLFNNIITFVHVLVLLTATVYAAPVDRHARPDGVMAARVKRQNGVVAPGQTAAGKGTWYNTGLGSCGKMNTDSDLIVAVSKYLYDGYPGATLGNPNNNPICGKKINVSYGGKTVTVEVVDRCATPDPGCLLNDLDFSPAAFTALADQSVGVIDMTWEWAPEEQAM